jgi:hypothetical protein
MRLRPSLPAIRWHCAGWSGAPAGATDVAGGAGAGHVVLLAGSWHTGVLPRGPGRRVRPPSPRAVTSPLTGDSCGGTTLVTPVASGGHESRVITSRRHRRRSDRDPSIPHFVALVPEFARRRAPHAANLRPWTRWFVCACLAVNQPPRRQASPASGDPRSRSPLDAVLRTAPRPGGLHLRDGSGSERSHPTPPRGGTAGWSTLRLSRPSGSRTSAVVPEPHHRCSRACRPAPLAADRDLGLGALWVFGPTPRCERGTCRDASMSSPLHGARCSSSARHGRRCNGSWLSSPALIGARVWRSAGRLAALSSRDS